MKQCKCGGLISEHELTKNREAWHCKSCGRYEIIDKTQNVVDYYANLALHPNCVDYVRHQVRQMEKDPSGLWVGLGQAVADRMKELNDSNNIQS